MKTFKIPKTIKKWLDSNKDKVDEYWLEDDGYESDYSGHNDVSIWVVLKQGYRSSQGTSMIHAGLVKTFMIEVQLIQNTQS